MGSSGLQVLASAARELGAELPGLSCQNGALGVREPCVEGCRDTARAERAKDLLQVVVGVESLRGRAATGRRPPIRKPRPGDVPNRKQLVGLLTDEPATVLPEGAQITEAGATTVTPVPMLGHVTSSYFSPTLKRSIAMALVRNGHQRMGQKVQLPLVDGRVVSATVASPVFYDPEGKRHHV
jgi:hypothetical protein